MSRPLLPLLVEGVSKSFGSRTVLRDVSLQVAAGSIHVLLGPNGAGKTTLASLVTGLRRPTAGQVRIGGADPRTTLARAALGCTPQRLDFPPVLRVREVLRFVTSHFADAVSFDEIAARFDLAELAEQQCGGLSGGQLRRLGLACAFIGRPRLAVLDEPSTGLDLEARAALWVYLRDFRAAGGSVLFSTHSLEEAEALADVVSVLHDGQLNEVDREERDGGDAWLAAAYRRLTGEAA